MNLAQRAFVFWANLSGSCVGRRKSLAALMQRILGAVAVSDGAVWLRFHCKTNAGAQFGLIRSGLLWLVVRTTGDKERVRSHNRFP